MRIDGLMKRHNVSRAIASKVSRAVREYIKAGASEREAQASAIEDHIEELRVRRRKIEKLASRAAGRGPGGGRESGDAAAGV